MRVRAPILWRRQDGRLRRGLLSVSLVVLVACASGGAALPPPAPEFDVTMREYRFEHNAQAPRGRVVFRVRNGGTLHHEATLVRLPPDSPSLYDQFHGSPPQVLSTVVVFFDRPPGGGGVFAADLEPGRYGFICFLRDADGVQHAFKGMTSEFTVA